MMASFRDRLVVEHMMDAWIFNQVYSGTNF